MKKIANLKGVKVLSKGNQKFIEGSRKGEIEPGQLCGIFPHFVICLPLETCIKGECHAL